MDEHVMIWEFSDAGAAEVALFDVNAALAVHLQHGGYSVEADRVVGKNAETGSDVPDSLSLINWDTPRQSPDGTYYFLAPAFYTSPIPAAATLREQPLSWISGS